MARVVSTAPRDGDGDGDGEEIWILDAPNSSGDIGTEHGAE